MSDDFDDFDPIDAVRSLREQQAAHKVIVEAQRRLPYTPFRYQFFDWERVRQDVYRRLVKR